MELCRADDSLVGAVSRVRSFWSPKVDSYVSSGSGCNSATSKFSTNAKLKVGYSRAHEHLKTAKNLAGWYSLRRPGVNRRKALVPSVIFNKKTKHEKHRRRDRRFRSPCTQPLLGSSYLPPKWSSRAIIIQKPKFKKGKFFVITQSREQT